MSGVSIERSVACVSRVPIGSRNGPSPSGSWPSRHELRAERRTILGVHQQVLVGEGRRQLRRRTGRDDPAGVDDADPVGLLGFLEVVGREHDRRPMLATHVAQVAPQRAAARRVEAGRRLVEEQHVRPVHEAAHDLELAQHPARVRLDRLEDVAPEAQQLGPLLDLAAVARRPSAGRPARRGRGRTGSRGSGRSPRRSGSCPGSAAGR